jgi:hypothetical protein
MIKKALLLLGLVLFFVNDTNLYAMKSNFDEKFVTDLLVTESYKDLISHLEKKLHERSQAGIDWLRKNAYNHGPLTHLLIKYNIDSASNKAIDTDEIADILEKIQLLLIRAEVDILTLKALFGMKATESYKAVLNEIIQLKKYLVIEVYPHFTETLESVADILQEQIKTLGSPVWIGKIVLPGRFIGNFYFDNIFDREAIKKYPELGKSDSFYKKFEAYNDKLEFDNFVEIRLQALKEVMRHLKEDKKLSNDEALSTKENSQELLNEENAKLWESFFIYDFKDLEKLQVRIV